MSKKPEDIEVAVKAGAFALAAIGGGYPTSQEKAKSLLLGALDFLTEAFPEQKPKPDKKKA